jgi:Fe2+ transport system protein B
MAKSPDIACRSCGIANCAAAQLAHGEHMTTVALAGNPNVGKTSVFNALTGLRQHTGNWPGKTVTRAEGSFVHNGRMFCVIDLPGTYSLSARSAEEEVARDFICFGRPEVTVVVVDATALERNLNLALQTAEITERLIVCVNLLDEARRKKITVDLDSLAKELGVPVVGTVARAKRGIDKLKDLIDRVASGELVPKPRVVAYPPEIEAKVAELIPRIEPLIGGALPARWVALRLIEGDRAILPRAIAHAKEITAPLVPTETT